MKKKAIVKVLLTLIFLLALLFIFKSGIYNFSSTGILTQQQRATILRAADSSLETFDVPVGALLLYNDTVLSSGSNTVLRDSNAAGHAEINAINQAIREIGFASFSKLNRDKLVLVSTFKPCLMCRGAIIENQIRQSYFMKGKGVYHWLKEDAKQVRYELNKRKIDGSELQDSLFMLHPKFMEQNSTLN